MSQKIFEFTELCTSKLIIDALYRGGNNKNAGDDPISKLLPVGILGGFRASRNSLGKYALIVLYTSMNEPDWPDRLDIETGLFYYYGDNRTPGHSIEETPKKGNKILADCFEKINAQNGRNEIPPFFIFSKAKKGRDVIFRGIAAPGTDKINPNEQLIAIWKSVEGQRFQNYRAIFTILDEKDISRKWLIDLQNGNSQSSNCPKSWKKWVQTGIYSPLDSEPILPYRKKIEQIPAKQNEKDIIKTIYHYFKKKPTDFELCAAKLAKMMDKNIMNIDVTRPTRDGGRDAIGKYHVGTTGDSITFDFALEAKCYAPGSGVSVRWTSRLISRLRHRQFGIFITTSHLDSQAYKEIREDKHPIIVIAGIDIVNILREAGYGTPKDVETWLKENFPKNLQ